MNKSVRHKTNRLYNDLVWLWPIWEDVEEYGKEGELFAELIKKHSICLPNTLLDIGCGSGKFTFHLKKHFKVTGIDISKPMLCEAKKLNPDCEFVHGDMRNFNLRCQFDSIFINDSIAYMTTKADLSATFKNAYKHLKASGVMIAFPEVTKETFVQNRTEISLARANSKPENLEVTFIENYYDPDVDDETYEATIVFLIRENGKLRIEHDLGVCGLFELLFWKEALSNTGFELFEEPSSCKTVNFPVFVCVKPTMKDLSRE